MRSRVSTVLARHGLPGKLFGGVRGAGNLIGGLTNSLKGSVSAGAVLAGALSLHVALVGTIPASGVLGGNLTAGTPAALSLDFSTMTSLADLTAKGVTFTSPGGGQYRNASGSLVTAGVNEPRFHHAEDGTPLGLLMDAATGETASMTGTNFSSWYNQSAGTIEVEGSYLGGSSTVPYLFGLSDAGLSQYIAFNPGGGLLNTTGGASAGVSFPTSGAFKIAFGYQINDIAGSSKGAAVTTTSTFTPPTAIDQLWFFSLVGNNGTFGSSGIIKSFKFYNTRKPNVDLRIDSAQTYLAASGDSTVAAYLGQNSIASYITFAPWNDIAVPGNTIAQQQTIWTALDDKLIYDAVVVQVGLNDLDPAESAATAIARLQAYVTLIRSGIQPSAKILISQMTPCKARLIFLYGATDGATSYQKWLDMNDAIAGNGAHAITGVDARITSHVAALNDGAGNLAAAYEVSGSDPDHIHENNAGRQIIATAWQTALASLGITA